MCVLASYDSTNYYFSSRIDPLYVIISFYQKQLKLGCTRFYVVLGWRLVIIYRDMQGDD